MQRKRIIGRVRGGIKTAVLCMALAALMSSFTACQTRVPFAAAEPVKLRLGVALTPQELATFQQAVESLDEAHPEFEIVLETTPQGSVQEKITSQVAAGDLPDVVRLQGLLSQPWIRKGAFLDLTDPIARSKMELDDFYPGPLEQYRWEGKIYGLPDTAAPEVVFYNKTMFDQAGLSYPSDDWTIEDMHAAALKLTRDAQGRSADEAGFDPNTIQQWGWNGGLTYFWQRHLARALGGDFCPSLDASSNDCTTMNFTAPETVQAVQWWANLVSKDHAALYDPYGGSQTGVPGDPFIAGKAAMGFNGFFAVGQLNDASNIQYDIVQPFKGVDGKRYTPVSVNGYLISSTTEHTEEAWSLVQALLEPQFLTDTWGKPGHAVPARRSVAQSVINPSQPPANQQAILDAMEYGEVFKPYTASAFNVYGKTSDYFLKAMKGEMDVAEAMAEVERIANEILAADRED